MNKVGQVFVNQLVSNKGRTHCLYFDINPNKNGTQTFENGHGLKIATISVKDGKKNGRAAILLNGYFENYNAVDIVVYKDDQIVSSRIYLIRFTDIDDLIERIRETYFENGAYISDKFYVRNVLIESSEIVDGCQVNAIYENSVENHILSLSKYCENNYITHAKRIGGQYEISQFEGDMNNVTYTKNYLPNGSYSEYNRDKNYSFFSEFIEDENGTILKKTVRSLGEYVIKFNDSYDWFNIEFNFNNGDYTEDVCFNANIYEKNFVSYTFKNDSFKLLINDSIKIFNNNDDLIYYSKEVKTVPFFKTLWLIFKGVDYNMVNYMIGNLNNKINEEKNRIHDAIIFAKEIDSGVHSLTLNKILNG